MTLLLLLSPVSANGDDETFRPFIQRYSNGWIDWQEGLIYGIGRGYVGANTGSKLKAQGAASVQASASIVKLAAGINVDDGRKVLSLGRGNFEIHLKAIIKDKLYKQDFIKNNLNPYFEVIRVAPINGVSGLTINIISRLKESVSIKNPQTSIKETEADDEDRPWLVLDMRRAEGRNKIEPALLPKILSDSGAVIYNLSTVERDALMKRGMVQYVTTNLTPDELRKAKELSYSSTTEISGMLSLATADAAEKKKRGKFIVKDAKTGKGLYKTNLVISAEDAEGLKKEDTASGILKNCRVLVVTASPVGGIEGKLIRYFAGRL